MRSTSLDATRRVPWRRPAIIRTRTDRMRRRTVSGPASSMPGRRACTLARHPRTDLREWEGPAPLGSRALGYQGVVELAFYAPNTRAGRWPYRSWLNWRSRCDDLREPAARAATPHRPRRLPRRRQEHHARDTRAALRRRGPACGHHYQRPGRESRRHRHLPRGGLQAAEVAGGCCGYRFDDFTARADELLQRVRPNVLLPSPLAVARISSPRSNRPISWV